MLCNFRYTFLKSEILFPSKKEKQNKKEIYLFSKFIKANIRSGHRYQTVTRPNCHELKKCNSYSVCVVREFLVNVSYTGFDHISSHETCSRSQMLTMTDDY